VRRGLEDHRLGGGVAQQSPDVVEDDADTRYRRAEVQPDRAVGARDEVDEAGAVAGDPDGLAGVRVGDDALVVEVELGADGVARLVEEGDDAIGPRESLDEGDAAGAGADLEGALVLERLDLRRGGEDHRDQGRGLDPKERAHGGAPLRRGTAHRGRHRAGRPSGIADRATGQDSPNGLDVRSFVRTVPAADPNAQSGDVLTATSKRPPKEL
jgi:hypothetical protein